MFLKLWEKCLVCPWSAFRYRKDIKESKIEKTVQTPLDVGMLAQDVRNHFTYKRDSIWDLGDTMRSPAQCYESYKIGALVDDCDGFHAALYHAVAESGHNAELATVASPIPGQGHTILLYQIGNRWGYKDYTSGDFGWKTRDELIEHLFVHYQSKKPLFISIKVWNKTKKRYYCEEIIDASTNK